MARKPTARTEFVLFNVYYEDGSQRSNRRVPADLLGGIDGDEPARAVIEEQDREISAKSGMAPLVIKDKVLIGSVGGEFGVRGFLAAIDAKGHVPVPRGPGLGVEIDWDWVSRNRTAVVEYKA